jgi:hypothetical protein
VEEEIEMPGDFSEEEYRQMQADAGQDVTDACIDIFKNVFRKDVSSNDLVRIAAAARQSTDVMTYSSAKRWSKASTWRALRLGATENVIKEFRADDSISKDHVLELMGKDGAWLQKNVTPVEMAKLIPEVDFSDYV